MTLLADRLIETAIDRHWPPTLRADFAYAATKIKSAQRFVVSDDVAGAIRSLISSRPSTLIEASRFARLPFERCWFEWAVPGELNLKPGQIEVKRCGALMENYGPHGYSVWTAWEFSKPAMERDIVAHFSEYADFLRGLPPFGISMVVGAWDLSSMTARPLMLSDPAHQWFTHKPPTIEEFAALRNDNKNGVRWALKDKTELEALYRLESRSAFRIHNEVHGAENISSQFAAIGNIDSVVYDVQDEMGHLFATLILMNSKNCVEIAKIEHPEKLNKARRKQGKAELLPYSTVRIELTKSQERAVMDGRISREEARRHLVRGHFKVRSTGVFWWGNFWRGNALRGVIERRGHVIEQG